MNLHTVWNEVALLKNVDAAAVQKHLDAIEARRSAGAEIAPIVHCDVMGTLYNRNTKSINHTLLDILRMLEKAGRQIKIISADPVQTKGVLGTVPIGTLVDKSSHEMIADLCTDNTLCELLIEDQISPLARHYASYLHPDALVRSSVGP